MKADAVAEVVEVVEEEVMDVEDIEEDENIFSKTEQAARSKPIESNERL
jgi:hypothetical protein